MQKKYWFFFPSPFSTGFLHFLSAANCCDNKEKLQTPNSQPIEKTKGKKKNPWTAAGLQETPGWRPTMLHPNYILGEQQRAPNTHPAEAETATPLDRTSQLLLSLPEPTVSAIWAFNFIFFYQSLSLCGHGKEITLHL